MNKNENNTSSHFAFASSFSRFSAMLVDLALIILSSIILLLGVRMFASNLPVVNDSYNKFYSLYIDSELYYEDANGELGPYKFDNYLEYENVIHRYYSNNRDNFYKDGNKNNYWYNVFLYGQDDVLDLFTETQLDSRLNFIKTKGHELFEYDGENYQILAIAKSDSKAEDLLLYYYNEATSDCLYATAIIDLRSCENFSSSYFTWYMFSSIIPILICFGLSTIILRFIIPLFMKHKNSLGKKAMHLGVIDRYGKPLSKIKFAIRFWLPFLVLVGTYMLLGILMIPSSIFILISTGLGLVSFIISSFTPGRRCLHDFIVNSAVIDLRNSVLIDEVKKNGRN